MAVDFYVIYNRAMTSLAETEDCNISLDFTEHLVKILEEKGHKGHFADRDAVAGANIFQELFRNIQGTRKTFLVVTPEFLSNCWSRYAIMAAFKHLIDSNKCDKLIPIGIGITGNQKLQELNIKDWIHFTTDWSPDKRSNVYNWDKIIKALSPDCPASTEETYPKSVHDQEYGDDKLRTDQKTLVVQPDSLQDQSKDFFTEKFLLGLAVHFLSDWQLLALQLNLRDEIVKEVALNNPNNVRMQAYNALLRWKNSYGVKQENRINDLLPVLMEMGRRDLAENIEAEYNEFMRQYENPNEGVDEVDMGMSRKREEVLYLRRAEKTLDDNEQGNNTGDPGQNKTYIARELKAESTACIELKPRPESQTSPLDSLELKCGPSMSLPTAPLMSLPLGKPTRELPKNAATTQQENVNKREKKNSVKEAGSDVLNEETNSTTRRPKATESVPVDEHISPSQTANLNQEIKVDSQAAHRLPGGENANSKYKSQQSLSRDSDLTADVNGTFSFNGQPNNLPVCRSGDTSNRISHNAANATDTAQAMSDSGNSGSSSQTPNNLPVRGSGDRGDSSNRISHNAPNATDAAHAMSDSGYSGSSSQTPNNLPVCGSGDRVDSSNRIFHNAANATDTAHAISDSGYSGSSSQTPLDEQIILNKGNQSQEAENSSNNAADATNESDNTLDPNDSFSLSHTPISEEINLNEGNQTMEVNITTANSTGFVIGTDRGSLGLNINSDEFDEQDVTGENSRLSPSERDSSISSHGQPQSLRFRMLSFIVNSVIKPELAYS